MTLQYHEKYYLLELEINLAMFVYNQIQILVGILALITNSIVMLFTCLLFKGQNLE